METVVFTSSSHGGIFAVPCLGDLHGTMMLQFLHRLHKLGNFSNLWELKFGTLLDLTNVPVRYGHLSISNQCRSSTSEYRFLTKV